MMKTLGDSLKYLKSGEQVKIAKISRAIEINFSGIFNKDLITKIVKNYAKKKKKQNKLKQMEENSFELVEEKTQQEIEKIQKIKERRENMKKEMNQKQKVKGLNKNRRSKLKNTSENLFKMLYLKTIKKEKNEKISFEDRKTFKQTQNLVKLIRSNILTCTGRYLMLFYDNLLSIKTLYSSMKK